MYKKFPENPVGKYKMENDVLRGISFFFPGRDVLNRNSCSISSKSSLIPVSGLRGQFSENETDLGK